MKKIIEENTGFVNTATPKAAWFFTKMPMTRSYWKEGLFNKWHWDSLIPIWGEMNFSLYLSPQTKINSRRIIDLNVKARTIKPLEEYTGRYLYYLELILLRKGRKKALAVKEKSGKLMSPNIKAWNPLSKQTTNCKTDLWCVHLNKNLPST